MARRDALPGFVARVRRPAPRVLPPELDEPARRRPALDPPRRMAGDDAAIRRIHAGPRIGGRELSPLLPRDARRALRGSRGRRHADRDGRAAAARGLPPVRARGRAAARCRRQRAPGRRAGPRARLPAADRLWRLLPICTVLDATNARRPLRRRDRGAGQVAARERVQGSCRRTTRRCSGANCALFPEWYVARHLGVSLIGRTSSAALDE